MNGWINAGDNGSLGYTNGDQRVVHGLLKGSGRRIHKEHSGIMEINDVEAALAAIALYGVARLGSRALHRHLSPTARMAAVLFLVVLLFGTALTGIYSTPLVAEGRPINLLQLIA